MSKKLLRTICVVIVSMMAISLVACGGSANTTAPASSAAAVSSESTAAPATSAAPAEKVKLKIYAQYADEDTKAPYDYAVAALQKEMPNVELELDVQAQDDGQKLKTYAATGNMPDIFQSGLNLINTFKKSGNILMLDEYAQKLGWNDKILPSAKNVLVSDDGHTWAFPYAGNELIILYYNKELFEKNGVKVPTTYDEMMTAVKTFNSKGIIPLSIFAKEKWPCVALFDVFATRMEPKGITLLDAGKAKASDDAYKKAAEEEVALVKAGLVQKGATNTNYDQAAALFYQGKAAMFLNGQWEIEGSTKNLGDKVDWMSYPAPDAATYDKMKFGFSGGGAPGGYSVNASTKDKELAAKVASFMSLMYDECKYTTRSNPMIATKVDKPIVKPFPPMMDKLSKVIPNITGTSAFDWGITNPKFQAPFEDSCQRLLTGTYSADQFAKDVDKAIAEANK